MQGLKTYASASVLAGYTVVTTAISELYPLLFSQTHLE